MDFQQLDILEDKIKKLLATIKNLQSENQLLARKGEESERTIHKLRNDLEKWSKSAVENESLGEEISHLKKEREEIKNKVERLISQMDELEAKI